MSQPCSYFQAVFRGRPIAYNDVDSPSGDFSAPLMEDER
jgi:hypothetical protein